MSDEISGGSVILLYDVDSLFSDELQQLQVSGTGIRKNLTKTDGTMIQFSVADNDNYSTNELESLSLSNDTLSLSDGGEVFLPYRLC